MTQSDHIVRRASVDRSRTPQKVLDDTGRRQHTDKAVVESMPKGAGDDVEVVFFRLGRWVSDNDLEKEYELRRLISADPYSVVDVNQADPAFADKYPNGTHWKKGGKWCFIVFDRWGAERGVFVLQSEGGWPGTWWFAGIRKVQN